MTAFSYAVQINPKNGQHMKEFLHGCELESPRRRTWHECRTNPLAATVRRWPGSVLVITSQRDVYLVSANELDGIETVSPRPARRTPDRIGQEDER